MSVECQKVLDTKAGCAFRERNPARLLRHPAVGPGEIWDVEDLGKVCFFFCG
jgi:hypothetical protein